MARSKKNMTLEEQLQEVEIKITSTEEQLKDLKSKKKSIEAAIKEEKLSKLLAAIEEKGITVEDAIAKLSE